MSAVAVPTKDRSASLTGNTLVIRAWQTSDTDVVGAARAACARGEDLDGWISAVVRSGAAATTVASAGADLSRLERAVDTLGEAVTRQVTSSLGQLELAVARAVDPRDGQIAAASQAAVSRLADGVSKLLTGPDATMPARVQLAVREVTDQSLGEIQRALAAQASSVQTAVTTDRERLHQALLATVHHQHHELLDAVGEVRTSLALRDALSGAEKRSSRKGFTFERACAHLLGGIAAHAGDGGA